uniref:invasion associated locus B family protein n=1 Tax=Pararhizobium sp. IMCC3301 TaxID=3067904 RepID=UPI0027416A05|nr:invasion associated locus B family protein [Pararhizobium sp. IMCC3301]
MSLLNQKIATATTIAAAVLAVGFGGAAHAQENTPAETAWVKVCNKDPNSEKDVCLTTQEIRADTGQFLASVAVREIGGNEKQSLVIAVPPGMLIQPGLRLQVDKNKQKEIKYGICFPNACYAELPIDPAVVAEMKRGNELILTTLNQQAKAINFKLTLVGFTASYDGSPIDPAQLKVQQEKLREELQQKAEAARQRLIEQQQKPAAN